jgi:hypothetical protein
MFWGHRGLMCFMINGTYFGNIRKIHRPIIIFYDDFCCMPTANKIVVLVGGFGSRCEDITHSYRFEITKTRESIPGSIGRSCYFYRFWITKQVICPPLFPRWGGKLNCKTLKVEFGSLACWLEIPDVRFQFSARRQDIRYEACLLYILSSSRQFSGYYVI